MISSLFQQQKAEAWRRLGLCLIQGLNDPDDRGLEADVGAAAAGQEGEGEVMKGIRRRVRALMWMMWIVMDLDVCFAGV